VHQPIRVLCAVKLQSLAVTVDHDVGENVPFGVQEVGCAAGQADKRLMISFERRRVAYGGRRRLLPQEFNEIVPIQPNLGQDLNNAAGCISDFAVLVTGQKREQLRQLIHYAH
jgi:hypothetical protein